MVPYDAGDQFEQDFSIVKIAFLMAENDFWLKQKLTLQKVSLF